MINKTPASRSSDFIITCMISPRASIANPREPGAKATTTTSAQSPLLPVLGSSVVFHAQFVQLLRQTSLEHFLDVFRNRLGRGRKIVVTVHNTGCTFTISAFETATRKILSRGYLQCSTRSAAN